MRQTHSEMFRRDAFDRVRLVDDEEIVRVKVTRTVFRERIASAQENEEQAVIEDHNVGRIDPPPRLLVKAARSIAAAGALGADTRLAANQIPDRRVRQWIEIGQRSVSRATTPI